MDERTGLTRGSEFATRDLLDRVRAKGRTILFATEDSEELRYLDKQGVNGNVGGESCTHILLREDPRLIEVWEEFLHGTQFKCGLVTGLSSAGSESEDVDC